MSSDSFIGILFMIIYFLIILDNLLFSFIVYYKLKKHNETTTTMYFESMCFSALPVIQTVSMTPCLTGSKVTLTTTSSNHHYEIKEMASRGICSNKKPLLLFIGICSNKKPLLLFSAFI